MSFFRKNRVLLTLFLAAFALRLVLVLTARGIATDGCSYLRLAERIVKGDFQSGINAFLPPLFPLLSAGASFLFRDLELSGRMVSCMAGALTVLPLFFLIEDVFDRKVAVATVVFYIVHPYLLQASGAVLTEATYFFLITSLAWILWRALKGRKTAIFALIGFVACLVFLARPEGIAVILLVLGWIWLSNSSDFKRQLKWKLISSFFCILAYLLVLSPFYLHFHRETGSWMPTSRHLVVVDDKGETETWSHAIQRVLKWKISSNVPALFHAVPKAYYPVFLIFLFWGLIRRKIFKGFRAGEAYILSFILLRIAVVTIFAGVTDRYFYAFIPMALCWAGVGFWELNNRLLSNSKAKECKIGGERISRISGLILFVICALCLPKGLKPIRANRAIQKKVGYWLKNNAGKEEFVVMARKPQEAFYAGAKYYDLRTGTYEEIINRARDASVDFIIIDRSIVDICPGFDDMVKEKDLDVFCTVFESTDRKITIYKLK